MKCILGIETSCDETAASVVELTGTVRSNVVATQIPVHARYGGVVPELASRNHVMSILPVVREALNSAYLSWSGLAAIAVTQGPGLIGALLVGIQTAKSLAYAFKLPLIAVDHVEAHVTAAMLSNPKHPEMPTATPPYVAMVASGGHTALYRVDAIGNYTVLGHTLDDAAGEAFDKVAKMMGLPYPGGLAIDRVSREGNPAAIAFPRGMMGAANLDFSFSGLKTAVRNYLANRGSFPLSSIEIADIAASAQEAIVDVLVEKTIRAARGEHVRQVVLSGGVAANHRLRERLSRRCEEEQVQVVLTPLEYCTDNAAMVANLGRLFYSRGEFTSPDALDAYANLRIGSPRGIRVRESP
ncbi:MAG: tRNA (adenosine(37)-N6)-threonylcarbamoyltransferase complex transferase subunit TsaD [Myxococcales bacterium]|nr:tRNA (adenosine(37)-N6)-threonylcarbamoyltransferase complex transferase subunit TsaD [Myxococcales bacterium]